MDEYFKVVHQKGILWANTRNEIEIFGFAVPIDVLNACVLLGCHSIFYQKPRNASKLLFGYGRERHHTWKQRGQRDKNIKRPGRGI
jgi:hypothetical protein